jgi:hypothetical protein
MDANSSGNPHIGGVGGNGGDGVIVISVPNNLKVSISPDYDQAYISCSNVDITVVPKNTLNVTGNLTATGTITGATFVGDGSALTGINNMNIVDTNEVGTYYPTFVSGTGANQVMRADATTGPLSYNPSTATLSLANLTATGTVLGVTLTASGGIVSAGTITGATFVGDGSALTGIDNMNIVDTNLSGTYYPVFVVSTGANQVMRVDATTGPLSYAPSSSTLYSSTFSGNLVGNAATATNATNQANGVAIPAIYFFYHAIGGSGSTASATNTFTALPDANYMVFTSVYYGFSGSGGTYNQTTSSGAINTVIIFDVTTTSFSWVFTKGTGNNSYVYLVQMLVRSPSLNFPKDY